MPFLVFRLSDWNLIRAGNDIPSWPITVVWPPTGEIFGRLPDTPVFYDLYKALARAGFKLEEQNGNG